jgi:hypothetical protein
VIGSNSLADLATRIQQEHSNVGHAVRQALRHAVIAGQLLIEAKGQLKHGQWLPWLRGHCNIPERTVSHYMRLARRFANKSAKLADLTVTAALDALAPPEPDLFGRPARRFKTGRFGIGPYTPVVISQCADCGLGTIVARENYTVHGAVWDQAWPLARRKPWRKVAGQQILCVGCLEHRIGRQLIANDFHTAGNDVSERLAARLKAAA